jgi:F-type H+-transporting ATPase subunit delta
MNRVKQARRDAKQLFRQCLADGSLDEGRVRRVVERVAVTRNRNRLKVLAEFLRLVKFDTARHTATVESAVPLEPGMQDGVRAELSRAYGPRLNTSFTLDPTLIGGMRIRVGSDVYDGSVKNRLAALEASF